MKFRTFPKKQEFSSLGISKIIDSEGSDYLKVEEDTLQNSFR